MSNQTAQFNGEVGNIESNVNKVDTFSEDITEEAAKQKYPNIKCLMNLIDKVFPIGRILSFDTDINPNELYGGTWERIKGRVIWGIDDGETAGCTGGEKTHTLTKAEMPKHRINLDAVNADVAQSGSGYHPSWVFDRARTVEVLSAEVGGGQPHNNMMPYYGAYVWRRTA